MREITKEQYKHFISIYENAKAFWLKELKDPRNAGIKPNTPLPYFRTAYELGHPQQMLTFMTNNKDTREFRKDTQAEVFEKLKANSTIILDKTFDLKEGGFDMKDSERARLALDFKKSTDKQYNPTQNVDLSITDLDFTDLAWLKAELAEELSLITEQDNEKEDN